MAAADAGAVRAVVMAFASRRGGRMDGVTMLRLRDVQRVRMLDADGVMNRARVGRFPSGLAGQERQREEQR